MNASRHSISVIIFCAVLLLPVLVLAQGGVGGVVANDNTALLAVETSVDSAMVVADDFVVGPTKKELELAPGQSTTFAVMLTNRFGIKRDFTLSVEDAVGGEDGETAVTLLGEDMGPYSVRDMVTLPVSRLTLQHGERAAIPVTITMPKDATPGGRYGSILLSVASLGDSASSRSVIISRVGVLLFVTTPGEVERAGELVEFATKSGRRFFSKGDVTFATTYQNAGSVHLNPYGRITVRNLFSNTVGEVPLEPWYVMPQSMRTRMTEWQTPSFLGYYTATLELDRGYEDVIDTKQVSFFIVNWVAVAVVFGSLLLLFVMVRFITRNFQLTRE